MVVVWRQSQQFYLQPETIIIRANRYCKLSPHEMEENKYNLKIGLEISMECPSATHKKAKSVLRGWRPGEYLIVDMPQFDFAFPVSTYLKSHWVVRFIHKGKVVGFKAKGTDSIPSGSLFVLEFPKGVEAHSMRKQSRAKVTMPVLVHTHKDRELSAYYKGVSLDISAGGIRLRFQEEIKKSGSYYLSFYLPTGEAFKNVECRAIKTSSGERGYEMGMEFVELNERHKKAIESCLIHFLDDAAEKEKGALPGEPE